MAAMNRRSVAEQAAEHMREGLKKGFWGSSLPGIARLAVDLKISRTNVLAALRILENEGLLHAAGRGKNRRITHTSIENHRLRVGILLHSELWDESSKNAQLLWLIRHELEAAGHAVFFADKSATTVKHEMTQLLAFIQKNPADAWIVVAGSYELLRWFAEQKQLPCFALYGRTDDLKLARAGPEMQPAILDATRKLIALGHRRIVQIVRSGRKKPVLAPLEQAFLNELTLHGIEAGAYNLPDWEESPAGFATMLEKLFRTTPPTALMMEDASLCIAAMQFLARRRIHVPEQVSLVFLEDDATLSWCQPSIAHLTWDHREIAPIIAQWIRTVRGGMSINKDFKIPARFVPGGSIGPVPRNK
jgi:DNA-binding LacI/PurR family transcriptional regulator